MALVKKNLALPKQRRSYTAWVRKDPMEEAMNTLAFLLKSR